MVKHAVINGGELVVAWRGDDKISFHHLEGSVITTTKKAALLAAEILLGEENQFYLILTTMNGCQFVTRYEEYDLAVDAAYGLKENGHFEEVEIWGSRSGLLNWDGLLTPHTEIFTD